MGCEYLWNLCGDAAGVDVKGICSAVSEDRQLLVEEVFAHLHIPPSCQDSEIKNKHKVMFNPGRPKLFNMHCSRCGSVKTRLDIIDNLINARLYMTRKQVQGLTRRHWY